MLTRQTNWMFVVFALFSLPLGCLADSYNAAGEFIVKGLNMANLVSRVQVENTFKVNLTSVPYNSNECNGEPDAVFNVLGNDIWLEVVAFDSKLPTKQRGKLGSLKNFKTKIWINLSQHIGAFAPIKLGGKEIKPDMTFDEFKSAFPVSAKHTINGEDKSAKYYAVLIDGSAGKGIKKTTTDDDPGYLGYVEFVFKNNKLMAINLRPGDDC